jgi:hypothetical protein
MFYSLMIKLITKIVGSINTYFVYFYAKIIHSSQRVVLLS